MTKYTAILLAPFVVFDHLKSKHFRPLLVYLVGVSIPLLISMVFLSQQLPFLFRNIVSQTSILNKSLSHIIQLATTLFSHPLSIDQIKLLTLLLFTGVLAYVFITKKLSLIERASWALLIYILTASPMIQSWYLIWPLATVFFIKSKALVTLLFFTSITFLFHYILYNVSLFFMPLSGFWQFIFYLAFVLPFLLLTPGRWYTRLVQKRGLQLEI